MGQPTNLPMWTILGLDTLGLLKLLCNSIKNEPTTYHMSLNNSVKKLTYKLPSIPPLQKITTCFTDNFGQKNPHMVFLPPCPT